MKKRFRQLLSALCAVLLLATCFPMVLPTYAEQESAAPTIDVSGLENLALGKTAVSSGLEVSDGRWTEENITDGSYAANSRWSSNEALTTLNLEENPDQNVWIYVDLGQETTFNTVKIHWQLGCSRNYDIQVSSDLESWTVLGHYEDPTLMGSAAYTETCFSEQPVTARYVRLYARVATILSINNYQMKCVSIYEMEVFHVPEERILLANAFEEVRNTPPTIENGKLVLPQPSDSRYRNTLWSSSNEAVIAKDGTVISPLNDKTVNIFYQMTDEAGNELHTDAPFALTVKGTGSADGNPKPDVVPSLQEWSGDIGFFVFNGDLVVADASLLETAEQIRYYFKEMLDRTPVIRIGTANPGDIFLTLDPRCGMGEEGYQLEIDELTTVTASTLKGLLYGGATLTQIMQQSDGKNQIPKGIARDYPQYPIRSVMLDVARFYVPLTYLTEITKFAAYYKINEIHLHINDNGGETATSFRIESKLYPELNAGLTAYSQDAYRQYQKEVKKYGIDVVTEIDTPSHSGVFKNVRPDLMASSKNLDLSNPETIPFIQSIYDEFLDGDDPVFQSSKVHLGFDEYSTGSADDNDNMIAYMNAMIDYCLEKGLEVRSWAPLGTNGFTGEVNTEMIAHMWSHTRASMDDMLAAGFRLINQDDKTLYIVPGNTTSYKNYLNLSELYDTWEVSAYGSAHTLAAGHPQSMGAEASLWNDSCLGMSEFDIFDRLKGAIFLISEKCWFGEKAEGDSGAQFLARIETLPSNTPGADPARLVESASELIAHYDFEDTVSSAVQDRSENGYTAHKNNLAVVEKDGSSVLALNGVGTLSLPFGSVGWPATVSFDLLSESYTGANAPLFTGADGTLYFNYQGTGKLGFERKGYSYVFDYFPETGRWVNFTLIMSNTSTLLYVDGLPAGEAHYYDSDQTQQSSTFVFPTEEIGGGIFGYLDNLTIYNCVKSLTSLGFDSLDLPNIALRKNVTISGVEGGYKEDGSLVYPQFAPENAVDGSTDGRVSPNQSDDAWLTVDLGKEYLIQSFHISFDHCPAGFKMQGSNNNTDWNDLNTVSNLTGNTAYDYRYQLPAVQSYRYIRYQQLEMFTNNKNRRYSGSFTELEVFGLDAAPMLDSAAQLDGMQTEQAASLAAAIRSELNGSKKIEKLIVLQNCANRMTPVAEEAFPAARAALLRLLQQSDTLFATDFSKASWDSYYAAVLNGWKKYYDPSASLALLTTAADEMESAYNRLMMNPDATVSTNMPAYKSNTVELLIDGNTSTFFYKNGVQKKGDQIILTFTGIREIQTVLLNAEKGGADRVGNADVSVSIDGCNWSSIGKITSQQDQITFALSEPVPAKYLKVETTATYTKWMKLNEIIINGQSPAADKTGLAFVLSKQFNAEDCDEALFAEYLPVQEEAERVLNSADASLAEIEAAKTALINAQNAIINAIDYQPLRRTLDAVRALPSALFTGERRIVLDALIAESEGLLQNNCTQQQADDQTRALLLTVNRRIAEIDISADAQVQTDDVILLMHHLNGWENAAVDPAEKDPNSDGRLSIADAVWLLRYLSL